MGRFSKIAGLRACSLLTRLRPPGGVPVLAYHSVDASGSYLSTRPDLFAAEMEHLASRGCTGVSMATLVARVRAGSPFQPGCVAITVDDGLANFSECAWPVLRRLGFSATLYVPTDFVGGEAAWYADYGLRPLPLSSWDDLKRLRDDGADIQSHGCSHRKLTTLTPGELTDELQRSREQLTRHLGDGIDHFCYPFGDRNTAVEQATAACGYQSAVTTRPGRYQPGENTYAIPRESLDMVTLTDAETARVVMDGCVDGAFSLYIKMRDRVRGLVGAGEGPSS